MLYYNIDNKFIHIKKGQLDYSLAAHVFFTLYGFASKYGVCLAFFFTPPLKSIYFWSSLHNFKTKALQIWLLLVSEVEDQTLKLWIQDC